MQVSFFFNKQLFTGMRGCLQRCAPCDIWHLMHEVHIQTRHRKAESQRNQVHVRVKVIYRPVALRGLVQLSKHTLSAQQKCLFSSI